MTKTYIDESSLYRTQDLALAAAISLYCPLDAIDKQNPQKAHFLFKRTDGFDELLESYWKQELKVEPQAYFSALRVIKARLYGDD